MLKCLLILSITIMIFGCKTSKPVTAATVDLPQPEVIKKIPGIELNGSWELDRLWGSNNKWETPPAINLNFEEKTFTGNTGCNCMNGSFTIKENFITINKDIVTTKMACSGYNENTFLSILLKVNRYLVENEILELSQDDIVLMRFIKK